MISVAGMQGMTAIRNSDYSASKAALMSFFDCLRQELADEGDKSISITNIYPYIINTQLFNGFSGLALKIIPMLDQEQVAKRVFSALYNKEQEVYIPWYCNILGIGMLVARTISEDLRMKIIKLLMGNGMKTLKCRGTNLEKKSE